MPEPRQLDLLERAIRALPPAEQVELRERLGEQCLWCGSLATVLCDGRLSDLGSSLATCDAPICSSCSTSTEIHGHGGGAVAALSCTTRSTTAHFAPLGAAAARTACSPVPSMSSSDANTRPRASPSDGLAEFDADAGDPVAVMSYPRAVRRAALTLSPAILLLASLACTSSSPSDPPPPPKATVPASTGAVEPPPEIEPTPTPEETPPEFDGPCPKGMALVEGGSFTDRQWNSLTRRFPNAKLVRDVRPFCLQLTETTNFEFQACTQAGSCIVDRDYYEPTVGQRPCVGDRDCPTDEATQPVISITDVGARNYCTFRAGRIPTVEEWFWAAWGGTENRKYPWGDQPPDHTRVNLCDKSCRLSGCEDTEGSERRTCLAAYGLWVSGDDGYSSYAPVGSFSAGAARWGHLDMLGNLGERLMAGNSMVRCGGSNATLRKRGELAYGDAEPIELGKLTCETSAAGVRCAADPR